LHRPVLVAVHRPEPASRLVSILLAAILSIALFAVFHPA